MQCVIPAPYPLFSSHSSEACSYSTNLYGYSSCLLPRPQGEDTVVNGSLPKTATLLLTGAEKWHMEVYGFVLGLFDRLLQKF
ncbi:hypothetical protein PM082_018216 [Marasmius tenuissimus]|nr:hypothetical protein PM082_018216 [Marasmius tenuissimus]